MTQPTQDTAVRVRALETVLRLEAEHPETAAALRAQWSRCLASDEESDTDIVIPVSETAGPLPETFGYSLASQVTAYAIEALAGKALMFHSAGLSDDTGQVVALVAPSGSGKTTAARELAGDGWGYVTDETVVVDDDRRVLAYPKPLSVVIDRDRPAHKTQRSPDELGLGSCPDKLKLVRIAILDRVLDVPTPPSLAWVPMLDGMMELIPQMSALPSLGRPLQRLCRLLDTCGLARLTYSDAKAIGPVLRGLMEAPLPKLDWAPLPVCVLPADVDGRFTQAEVRDAVRVDDEALFMVDRSPVRLSGLGLTLWEGCATGASGDELLQAAIAAHGSHPQAAELVSAILDEMVDAGVLQAGSAS